MGADERMPIMDQLVRCKNWIEAALAYSGGTHSFQDIVDGVLSGAMQLWAGKSGCAVTEISVYPRKKVFHVFLAAGDMEQIIDFQDSAIQFAKMNGCDSMTIAGRSGWKRVLDKHDWHEQFVVLEREI
jgi:hypothetical protein